MFELLYWPTPNGKKVTILIEGLGAAYRVLSPEERERQARILYNQRARPAPAGGLL